MEIKCLGDCLSCNLQEGMDNKMLCATFNALKLCTLITERVDMMFDKIQPLLDKNEVEPDIVPTFNPAVFAPVDNAQNDEKPERAYSKGVRESEPEDDDA